MKKIFILFLFFTAFNLYADSAANLKKARQFYAQAKYKDALSLFGSVAEDRNSSHRALREEALAFLAETQIRLGMVNKAIRSADDYEILFANGKYLEVIRFVKARIDLYEGAVSQASSRLFQILTGTRDSVIYYQAREQVLEILLSGTLSLEEMTRLVNENQYDGKLYFDLVYHLARQLSKEGRYRASAFYLNQLVQDFPKHEKRKELIDRLEQVKSKGLGKGVVLVVSPLNGPNAEYGAEVAKGVALAFEQEGLQDVSFQMIDSRGKPAYAVRRIQKQMEIENVLAVIGPIMSANAASLAAWMSAAYPEIPMLTPTATDRDIAALGNNIYQLNVPNYTLAQDMGKHAVLCDKVKKTMILAPRSDYGRAMVEGYGDAFEAAGGEIEALAFYTEGETDYNQVFRSLRQQKLLERKKKLATQMKTDDLSKVMSARDSERFLTDSTVHFESAFIAASDPNDAAILSKQLHFYKIDAQIYGSSGWYGKDVIRQGGRDIANAIFTAAFFEQSKEQGWVDFAQAFRKRWDEYPGIDKVSGLSYDAARIVLKALRSGADHLNHTLKEIKSYPGVYGIIKLNSIGENTNTQLVKIDNFKFVKLPSCLD